jgi:D-xylose transport system substrate-binding protein
MVDLRFRTKGRMAMSAMIGVGLVALMLAGCGTSSTPGGGGPFSAAKGCKKIGVLLPETATSARWDGKDRPLLEQLIPQELSGATVDYSNANGSAATQLNQAEADLTKGDCILVVAPFDASASATIVAKAKAQGVPVIAYDRLIQSNDLAYYVSFDNVRVGELQGQYIADNYSKYVTAQGNNNLVMINGAPTDNNALLFKQGALNKLQPLINNNSLKLVYTVMTKDWDNPTAQNEMAGALTANSNKIAVAYVANDGMATTVIAALAQQHLDGKVLVTGQDATVDGIRNILLGKQNMTVYKAISKEADATAKLVAALSKGSDTSSLVNGQTKVTTGSNIPSVLETPVAVDTSNIASTVLADNYVSKSDICQGVPAGTDNIC